jgi:hypothetical protein
MMCLLDICFKNGGFQMNKHIRTLVAVFAVVAIAGTVAAKPHHRRRRHHIIDPRPVVTQVFTPKVEEAPKPETLESTIVIPKVEVQPITSMVTKAIENVSPEIAPVVTEAQQAQASKIIRAMLWIKNHKVLTAGGIVALLVAADMVQNGLGKLTDENHKDGENDSNLKWVTPGVCVKYPKLLWAKTPWGEPAGE